MRLHNYLLLLLMAPLPLLAQEYMWQAGVERVAAVNYYRISLPPEVVSRLQPGLVDLRIMDEKQREVPYVLQTEETVTEENIFIPLTEMTSRVFLKCCSYYTVAIPDSYMANSWTEYPPMSKVTGEKGISSLVLKIKNADINKRLTLSGSDDSLKWYGIKEDYLLSSPYSSSGPFAFKIIEFPLSTYRYLRLELNDSSSKPLQVMAIGIFDAAEKQASYTEVPLQDVNEQQVKENGEAVTYYNLEFDADQRVERIAIDATADAGFYLRRAVLQFAYKNPYDTSLQFRNAREFVLISDEAREWDVEPVPSRHFRLKIYNEDNRPLKMEEIKLYQRKRYLVARLQPEMQYRLIFGNEEVEAPRYDLRFFTDQLPANPKIINTTSFNEISKDAGTAAAPLPFFRSKWFIWSAILVVAGLLGYMSLHMLREMRKR